MADGSLSACLAEIKTNPRKFYVYVMVRPCGTPFYVGKGNGLRLRHHEWATKKGWRGMRYSIIRGIWNGGGAVEYRLLEWFDDEALAFAAEVRIIAEIGRREKGGPLVNKTDGGDGPSGFRQVFTPETRAKISAAQKGRKRLPEHIEATARANRGKKRTPEQRQRMSDAQRRPEVRAKLAGNWLGKTHSEATKQRISEAKRGRKLTPEHRAKIAASGLGKKRSEQARANIRAGAFKRPPISEAERERLRQMNRNRPPASAETRRKLSEHMKAIRAVKKWGQRTAPASPPPI